MASEDQLRKARLEKIERLKAAGSQGFPNDFRVTRDMEEARATTAQIAQACEADEGEAERRGIPEESGLSGEEEQVWLYGRVRRKGGPFLKIQTPYGMVQALVRPKDSKGVVSPLSETDRTIAKTTDLADHVAVRGPIVRTRTGQIAVRAHQYLHVSKAVLPPPEKWHGLKDIEKRYRERYVDLWATGGVAEVFRARTLIVQKLREFLDGLGFLEVETPILHQVRGGATAKPFQTHHNALDMGLTLRIAPELYLKRLLVGGFDRVYEIGRNFRNEGISTKHNPEFTMLEYYMAYATYLDQMDTIEAMLKHVDTAVRERFPNLIGERNFELDTAWARIPMRDALAAGAQKAGHDLSRAAIDDPAALEAFAGALTGLEKAERKQLEACSSHGERIFALFEILAEVRLEELYRTDDGSKSIPVFITDYPFEVSPLSRKNDDDPAFVDRFELFVEGREIANAFSELNDPDDQAERFHAQLARGEKGDEEAMEFDADYIRALSHGMPPAAGLGLGVDRLVMLLCNQSSIRDVLLFPLLRPER